MARIDWQEDTGSIFADTWMLAPGFWMINLSGGTDTLVVNYRFDEVTLVGGYNSCSVEHPEGRTIAANTEILQLLDITFRIIPGRITLPSDLTGTEGNDFIFVSTYDNVLDGRGGDDLMHGGMHDDVMRGGDGDDILRAGNGADEMSGCNGADFLAGDGGGDTIHGNGGNDRISGGKGDDRMWGGGGADLLRGDGRFDWLYGGQGADRLLGGANADLLEGGDDDDRLFGQADWDVLKGDAGQDRLSGGGGNDFLDGGFGRDVLTGGRGRDTFHFSKFAGRDTITDFDLGADLIRITDGPARLARLDFETQGDDVLISWGRIAVLVENVSVAAMQDASNFEFL